MLFEKNEPPTRRQVRKVYYKMDIEKTGRAIVNSAIKVHRALGPGLLESVYQKCLKNVYRIVRSDSIKNSLCDLGVWRLNSVDQLNTYDRIYELEYLKTESELNAINDQRFTI